MMNSRPLPKPVDSAKAGYSPIAVATKSLLTAIALCAGIGGAVFFASGGSPWFAHRAGDVVDDAQKVERQNEFATIGPIYLAAMPESEVDVASQGMGLSSESRDVLLRQIKRQPSSLALAAVSTPPVAGADSAQNSALLAEPAKTAPEPSPMPETKAHPPLELVWITLWDTDAEDGDAVRITSQGYSRTISLTKAPVRYAIPVPASGTIEVTGIRDGEGGGITVGLASGASRAIFPIMSVNQTLGLRVAVRK